MGLCQFGDSLHHMLLAQQMREEMYQAAWVIAKEFLDRGEPVVLPDDPHSVTDEDRLALIRAWYECRVNVETEPEAAPIPQGRYVVGIDLASDAPGSILQSVDVSSADSSPSIYLSRSDRDLLLKVLEKPTFDPVPTPNRAQRRRQARQRCKRWK